MHGFLDMAKENKKLWKIFPEDNIEGYSPHAGLGIHDLLQPQNGKKYCKARWNILFYSFMWQVIADRHTNKKDTKTIETRNCYWYHISVKLNFNPPI